MRTVSHGHGGDLLNQTYSQNIKDAFETHDLAIDGSSALPKLHSNIMNLQQRLNIYRSIQTPNVMITQNDMRTLQGNTMHAGTLQGGSSTAASKLSGERMSGGFAADSILSK